MYRPPRVKGNLAEAIAYHKRMAMLLEMINRLADEGVKSGDIARALGVSANYVWQIKHAYRMKRRSYVKEE